MPESRTPGDGLWGFGLGAGLGAGKVCRYADVYESGPSAFWTATRLRKCRPSVFVGSASAFAQGRRKRSRSQKHSCFGGEPSVVTNFSTSEARRSLWQTCLGTMTRWSHTSGSLFAVGKSVRTSKRQKHRCKNGSDRRIGRQRIISISLPWERLSFPLRPI